MTNGSARGGWELDDREEDRSQHSTQPYCNLKIPIMSLCDDGNNPTLNDIKCSRDLPFQLYLDRNLALVMRVVMIKVMLTII